MHQIHLVSQIQQDWVLQLHEKDYFVNTILHLQQVIVAGGERQMGKEMWEGPPSNIYYYKCHEYNDIRIFINYNYLAHALLPPCHWSFSIFGNLNSH